MKKFIALILSVCIIGSIFSAFTIVNAATQVPAYRIVSNAKTLIGYPYIWGGESPEEGGFDCSGLVWYVYNRMSGINISLEQAGRDRSELESAGTKIIGISNFLPGDIVQFNGAHVAIYIGNNTIIEAPEPGKYVQYTTINSYSGIAYAIRLSSISQEAEPILSSAPTLKVQAGTANTNSVFTWNAITGAGSYNLKIWKDSYLEGPAYIDQANVSSGIGISLPAGTYYAYIDAINYSQTDWKMSNIVSFRVETLGSPILSVKAGVANTNSVFTWNSVSGAGSYNLKIWKDSYLEGDAYINQANVSSGIGISLPAGTYYAYIDAVNHSGTDWKMSNIISFKVEAMKPTTLSVQVGVANTNSVFTWASVTGATSYNLKIWKDVLFEGTAYITEIDATSPTNLSLPAGTYHAYVDACNENDWIMSNVVTFIVVEPAQIKATVEKSGNNFNITANVTNAVAPYYVIISGYNLDKLVDMRIVTDVTQPINLTGEIDKIKVMLWKDLSTLEELCEAEEIPSSKWITE